MESQQVVHRPERGTSTHSGMTEQYTPPARSRFFHRERGQPQHPVAIHYRLLYRQAAKLRILSSTPCSVNETNRIGPAINTCRDHRGTFAAIALIGMVNIAQPQPLTGETQRNRQSAARAHHVRVRYRSAITLRPSRIIAYS